MYIPSTARQVVILWRRRSSSLPWSTVLAPSLGQGYHSFLDGDKHVAPSSAAEAALVPSTVSRLVRRQAGSLLMPTLGQRYETDVERDGPFDACDNKYPQPAGVLDLRNAAALSDWARTA